MQHRCPVADRTRRRNERAGPGLTGPGRRPSGHRSVEPGTQLHEEVDDAVANADEGDHRVEGEAAVQRGEEEVRPLMQSHVDGHGVRGERDQQAWGEDEPGPGRLNDAVAEPTER